MSRVPNRTAGVVQIALSGLCFGFLGVFAKLAYAQGLAVGELLTYRFIAATFVLGTLLALFAPNKLRIPREQVLVCAGLGVFGYAVFATFYFTAIKGVSVALASLLLYTYPAMVAAGARLIFKERLSRAQKLALPLAAIGLVALLWRDLVSAGEPVTQEVTARTLAILAGLGSALCYSGYILASSRLQKTIDPLSSGLYVMFFASIGLALFHRPDFAPANFTNFETLSIILGIAFICTVLPMVLFLSGLQKLGNVEASLLSIVEPLTATVVGSFLLHEALNLNEAVGGAIVLAALVLTVLGSRERKPDVAKL